MFGFQILFAVIIVFKRSDQWCLSFYRGSYNATLSFGNCRLLAFYNWEPTQDEERNKLEQHLNENVRVGIRSDGPSLALVAARKMLEIWSPPDES